MDIISLQKIELQEEKIDEKQEAFRDFRGSYIDCIVDLDQ